MNLQEVFDYLRLQGSYDSQCRQYADLLDTQQKNIPVADELVGIQVSLNGICDWDRKKAFVNLYKHGADFEEISLLFDEPLPDGWILIDDFVDVGSEGENDRVYGFIPPSLFLVIKTQNDGGLVRLISARGTTKAALRKDLDRQYVKSSNRIFMAIAACYDDDGNILPQSEDRAFAEKFFDLQEAFWADKVSGDMAFFILVEGFGLSSKHASMFMTDWEHKKKNIDFLADQMGRL